MKRIGLALAGLALLAACAPGATSPGGEVLRFAEVDLAQAVPGLGGVYRSPIPVPTVPEGALADPDPRISDPAFQALRRLQRSYEEGYPLEPTPPEYHWRYGLYWKARGDQGQAARSFSWGVWTLASAGVSFDREGRDIWDYGYERTLALTALDPARAVRDARILAERASPSRTYQGLAQRLKGLELLARAQLAAKDHQGVLETAELYFREWSRLDSKGTSVSEIFRSPLRVALFQGQALEALGRKEEARRVYAGIVERSSDAERAVLEEARAGLGRLGPPPQAQPPAPRPQEREEARERAPAPGPAPSPGPAPAPSQEEAARRAVEGLLSALKRGNLLEADRYLAAPRFDPALQGRVGPEARVRAERARLEVSRVFPPNPAQPLPLVEVVYDLGGGPKAVRLPVLVGQGEAKVLNGAAPVVGSLLGLGEAIQGAAAFLEEYLAYLGLR